MNWSELLLLLAPLALMGFAETAGGLDEDADGDDGNSETHDDGLDDPADDDDLDDGMDASDEPDDDDPADGDDEGAGGDDEPGGDDKPADPEPGKINAALIARAEKAGLMREAAEQFRNPDSLERVLKTLEGKAADPEQKPADADAPATDEVELDPELYDPELISAFKAQGNRIKALESRLAEQGQATQSSRIDQMVDGLGKDYGDLLGSGPRSAMDPKSEQFVNRAKIDDEMETIKAGLQSRGKTVPGENDLFKKAVQSLFGDKTEAIARRKVSQQLNERSRKFIGRPSGRRGRSDLTPTQAAIKAVAAKQRQYGAGDDFDDDEG